MLTIANWSSRPFTGWLPCTVPALTHDFPFEVAGLTLPGEQFGIEVRRGMRCGAARSVWLHVEQLPAGSSKRVDLENAVGLNTVPLPPTIPPNMLADAMTRLAVRVNGLLMHAKPLPGADGPVEIDGPALRSHWQCRIGVGLIVVDVMLTWVPSEPWFRWEMLATAANPALPMAYEDLTAGLTLTVGNALIVGYGGQVGPFMRNQRIVHGASRGFAGIGGWLDLMTEEQREQCSAMLSGAPFVGVDDRWRTTIGGMGTPDHARDAKEFVRANYNKAVGAFYNTGDTGLGVARQSGNTGNQEGEGPMANGPEVWDIEAGPCAAFLRYCVAVSYAKRPCHWRDSGGDPIDYDGHPALVLWSGRPIQDPSYGNDKLGLAGVSHTFMDADGWEGPDRQHWFYPDLWLAAMLTASPMLQLLLEAQARLVWFGETTNPHQSTSSFDSSRSVGWFATTAIALMHCLRDGESRRRVRQRAHERIDLVYLPQLTKPDDPAVWDVRLGDPRLVTVCRHWYEDVHLADGTVLEHVEPEQFAALVGILPGYRLVSGYPNGQWAVWGQSIGAMLWLLASALEHAQGMECARVGAVSAFRAGWRNDGTGWKHWDTLSVPNDRGYLPAAEYVQGVGGGSWSGYRYWAMPLCAWIAAKVGVEDALACYGQLVNESANRTWLPDLGRMPSIVP